MKELNDRYAYIISNAAKTVGKSMDIYFIIEEDILIDDAQDIKEFIQYLVDGNRFFTEKRLKEEYEIYYSVKDAKIDLIGNVNKIAREELSKAVDSVFAELYSNYNIKNKKIHPNQQYELNLYITKMASIIAIQIILNIE